MGESTARVQLAPPIRDSKVYLHHVSLRLACSSLKHVHARVCKLCTATTHASKHDTIQWELQSSFLLRAGMRDQLLMLVIRGLDGHLGSVWEP